MGASVSFLAEAMRLERKYMRVLVPELAHGVQGDDSAEPLERYQRTRLPGGLFFTSLRRSHII